MHASGQVVILKARPAMDAAVMSFHLSLSPTSSSIRRSHRFSHAFSLFSMTVVKLQVSLPYIPDIISDCNFRSNLRFSFWSLTRAPTPTSSWRPRGTARHPCIRATAPWRWPHRRNLPTLTLSSRSAIWACVALLPCLVGLWWASVYKFYLREIQLFWSIHSYSLFAIDVLNMYIFIYFIAIILE